ncbi:MAG: WXG100 family type VII secretion target [Eubacteriales bacterium]|nr:WXG100 family type VII secretion target [Eubacteriales bacterium]
MATYSSIKFDFAKAKQEAARLENAADELKKIANSSMDSALGTLSSGWKGESADLYMKKGAGVKEDLISTANDLYAVANSIRKTAQRIYNAEMEAKRLAEEIARKSK